MNGDLKRAILEELVGVDEAELWQPGDVSLQELATDMGVTRATAKRQLDRLVSEGKLLQLKIRWPDHHWRVTYRKP